MHPYWDEIRRVTPNLALLAQHVSFHVISHLLLERPNELNIGKEPGDFEK